METRFFVVRHSPREHFVIVSDSEPFPDKFSHFTFACYSPIIFAWMGAVVYNENAFVWQNLCAYKIDPGGLFLVELSLS